MSTTEDATTISLVPKAEQSPTTISHSASPAMAFSLPTHGEGLDPAAITGKSVPDARKHTDMGWLGHDFTYCSLSEEKAASELERLAAPKVLCNGTVHAVSFQPHPEKHSQDRYVATEWDLKDRHSAGDETVDYTFATLPSKIEASLTGIPAAQLSDVDVISSMLRDNISALDESITQGILELFPSPEFLEKLSDDDIRAIVNDQSTSVAENADVVGPNNMKVTRGMRGTTVLVVLISPDGGIWTASLGDSQAVLAQKQDKMSWSTTVLSANHNASDPSEIARLKNEHPGEEADVVAKDLLLGFMAVTRAIGDHVLKLPSIYTARVFALTIPRMRRPEHNSQLIVERSRTPPYLSGVPEVGYVKLEKAAKACLLMCSDGLMDLYGGEDWIEKKVDMVEMFNGWVDLVGENLDKRDLQDNLALLLLRRGLRGPTVVKGQSQWTDEEALDWMSSLLTLEYKDKWMDDTTVVVEVL
ncbi:protein serine/threonine phosphatase 2C [Gymnopus androsaceus JB14]|uniref:Protein serine/threonine phosphatase 2C n=1 Tax=Gymnopus androsaceus JB14 TaxID=1447944 RepID=A0A6A4IC81_9AGAR|nr:protein serine/threonine phosphatase 2C [Gymnopus androsaceus JB14]